MQPLLLYGIAFLIGMLFTPWLLFPLLAALVFGGRQRAWLACCIAISGYCYYQTAAYLPPPEKIEGVGQLHIHEVSSKTVYGKSKYLYKGTFKTFKTDNDIYRNVFVMFYCPEKRPRADCDWIVSGTLTPPFFKPHAEKSWYTVKNTFSLAELRLKMKDAVKAWIFKKIEHKKSAQLLSGLVTGEFDDKNLKQAFSNLGLSHLLAISGFHFSIVALILTLLLKPFFSPRSRAWVMITLLALYCLFLGGAPSVLRAFIALSLFLASPLLRTSSQSENCLGAALILILVFDPMAANSIGFQLSFLATGACLLGFPYLKSKIDKIFPCRSKPELYALSYIDRIVCIILGYFKNALALNLAITVTLLPALLALFQTFPLASMIYNLFFPLLVALSIFLLILSIVIPWLHPVNSAYTAFLLDVAKEVPPELSVTLKTNLVTESIVIIYLTVLFTFILHKKRTLKYTIPEINL